LDFDGLTLPELRRSADLFVQYPLGLVASLLGFRLPRPGTVPLDFGFPHHHHV